MEMRSEKEMFEERLTETQAAKNRKQHQLARAALIGVLWILAEAMLTFVGIVIQKIGTYTLGYGTYWGKTLEYLSFNHLYYTLGLVFYIGMSFVLYYEAFDKGIKKTIGQNAWYAIIFVITGLIGAGASFMIAKLQLVYQNEHLGGGLHAYEYEPESMLYLTRVGWPIFIAMLVIVQTVKNIVITRIEKKKTSV